MLEAESIIFYTKGLVSCLGEWWAYTYAVGRLFCFCYGLHNAALLVGDIADPVCLSSGHNQMCVPATNVAIQLVILINLKLPRVGYMARLAVFEAIFAVDSRICLCEQRVFGFGLLELGRGCGRKEISKQRCHLVGHGEFLGEAASTIYQIVGSRIGPTVDVMGVCSETL